ncbi:putative secreted protein (Por secretion system target) [Tenacibaculum sp. 190524A05c]|uniref:T9SS type A sorting domain-containing protein n=1 Tax=Tenacibaculum platacis TaxID=3137852 RepID=UPI0031FB44A9
MKKKLLLVFVFASLYLSAQVFSTGTQNLKDDLSVNLEIDGTTTTLTLNGPANVWFAVGFDNNATNMFSSSDVFRTDGSTITDATTAGNQLPPADASQDWNLVSNTVAGNIRTIIATRPNNSGDSSDFVFSNSAGSIDVIWAFGSSTSYAYHGGINRGATTLGVTLSNKKFDTLDFDIFPNPISSKVKVQLPTSIESADIAFYDVSGRLLRKEQATIFSNNEYIIDELGSGVYFIKVSADGKVGSKMIVKR